MTISDLDALRSGIERHLPALRDARMQLAHAFVHDVVLCTDRHGARFAIKAYRGGVRTRSDIEWEVALHLHLLRRGAPLAALVEGHDGYITTVSIDGVPRHVTVSRWVPGAKPVASIATYGLLGDAAARIHAAADTFGLDRPATVSTLETSLHAPLDAIHDLLEDADRRREAEEVRSAIVDFVGRAPLDRGICHADLTLDNVHVSDGRIYVFDLDSAGRGWRAMEPAGVYKAWAKDDPAKWCAWLDGYRATREFSAVEEAAVPWLALVSDIDNVAWKLGRSRTAVGTLLDYRELPQIVDDWLAQSRKLTPLA